MDPNINFPGEGEAEELPDLVSTFQRLSLLVDQTWWTDKDYSDDYKLKSLELWNEVIQSNEMLSKSGLTPEKASAKNVAKKRQSGDTCKNSEKLSTSGFHLQLKDKLLLPTCRMEAAQVQEALAMMDPTVPAPLPQSTYTDTKGVLAASWPLALLKTYPAISDTLKDPSSRSVFSQKHAVGGIQKDENTLPYSINSVEEFLLHKKISSPAIKNIWAKDSEKIIFNQSKELKGGVWGPGLNANVPEFYPSVLLPPRQCPPRYSNIFGANYQSEVFPYNEEKTTVKEEPEVLVQKNSRRSTSEQRLPIQLQGVSSSSPNLLRSRHVGERTGLKLRQNETKAELTFWLQNVYPHRLIDLNKVGTVARHFERVSQHLALPFPQLIQSVSQPGPSPFVPSSERRLYRDVLARKSEDAPGKSKEEADQNPFDELERQALEQYQSSETCLVGQSLAADPVDSKFQDLEREALEQYTEDCDDQLDAPPANDPAQPTVSKGFSSLEEVPDNHRPPYILRAKSSIESDALVFESTASSAFSKMSSPPENDALSLNEIDQFPPGFAHCKIKQSKKQAKKKKKRSMAEEQKFNCGKQREKQRSGSGTSFQPLHAVSSEEEVRRLATNLKSKVLNYLKGVDLRIAEDNRKTNPKNKDSIENPIQRRIRVSDITDIETYKTYIREISAKTRGTLLLYFKRIRSEIMESSSRGIVSFVSPTTCEKRNIKKIIKKCLELKNHAETMVEIPRNLLNGIRREVLDTLDLVHHTMEVIYTLSNMSKEASEDVEYLKSGKGVVTELYLENTTLEDKSSYIRQRVLVEERSVLLVVLFPRVPGQLYDRHYESLNSSKSYCIYIDHDDLRYEHELSLRREMRPVGETATLMGASVRVNNRFRFPKSKMEAKDMWSPENWSHVLQVGEEVAPAQVTLDSTCRQAELFVRAALRLSGLVKARRIMNMVEALVRNLQSGQPPMQSRRESTQGTRTPQ